MPRLLLRGAYIRYCDLRFNEQAESSHVVVKFTSDLTDAVADQMNWPKQIPEGCESPIKLTGQIRDIQHILLTPNGGDMKKHEIQLGAEAATDFQLHEVKTGEDTQQTELRFQVACGAKGAAAIIQEYLDKIGRGVGLLKIVYAKQGEIEEEASDQDEPKGQQTLADVREMKPTVRGGRAKAAAE